MDSSSQGNPNGHKLKTIICRPCSVILCVVFFSCCLTVNLSLQVKKLLMIPCDHDIQLLITDGGCKSKDDKAAQREYLELAPLTTVDANIPSKIQVFYNIFTKDAEDEETVQNIVNKPFLFLELKFQNQNVYITSIGYQLKGIPIESINQQHLVGNEGLTLHSI